MSRGLFSFLVVVSFCMTAFRNTPGALRYAEMADKYVADGQPELALEYYSKAVAAEPEKSLHYTTRGFFLLKLKRYDEALNDFSAAIKIEPKSPSNYLTRGLVQSELKREKEADADFASACKLGSSDGCSFSGQK
jgi:tetratricopeptide (TPR) repeat protein